MGQARNKNKKNREIQEFNTILVFHFNEYPDLKKAPHLAEYPYSTRKRASLIDYFLNEGLNVMLYQREDQLVIFVDEHKFQQR